MSANNVTVGIKLTVDGKEVQGAITLTNEQLDALAGKIKKTGENTEDLDKKTKTLKDTLMGYKNEVLALAAAYGLYKVADYAKEAALLAARYETLGIVMNITGNNAGYTSAEMAKYQSSLEKTGISMLKSREALTAMAAAQLDLNKSTALGRLAQDLAVVSGRNSSETFKQLVTNIQQADTVGLKFMGITLDQAAAMNKYAVANHTTVAALTARQRAEATMNEVMLQGVKYTGIYEQAMGTAGKALSSLERYFENIKVKLGLPLLEGFAKGVFGVTDGVKMLNVWLDKLGTDGTMAKFASDFGQSAGKVIGLIWGIIGVVMEVVGVFVELVTGIRDFLREHEAVMTAAKIAAGLYAAYMLGPIVIQVGASFLAMTASAWGMVTGVGGALTAALAAARAFAAAMVLSASLVGWGAALVGAVSSAAVALGAAIISLPVLIGAAVIAAGVGIGYVLWQAFGDAITERFPKTVQFIKDRFTELKNFFSSNKDASAPASSGDDAAKAAAAAKIEAAGLARAAEAKALEEKQANLMKSNIAAQMEVAQVEAHNAIMKAMNSAADQANKQSYDNRTIDQEQYLEKKRVLDLAEQDGTIRKIKAEQSALSAAMAASASGAGGQQRDPTADATKMIALNAQLNAEGIKRNAIESDYAYRIGEAAIDVYTRQFGTTASLVDAKKDLILSSRKEVEEAGKDSQQIEALIAKRLNMEADALEVTKIAREASGKAAKEEIALMEARIDAMRGMAAARENSSISKFVTREIADTKTLADETRDINTAMTLMYINSGEEQIRIAAEVSRRRMEIAKNEALATIGGGQDDASVAKRKEVLDNFAAYQVALAANTDAKVTQASVGFKTLTDMMASAFDPSKPVEFGNALTGAFAGAGDAITKMASLYQNFSISQANSDKARAAAAVKYKDDAVGFAKAESVLNQKQLADKLDYYGNVAGAAKGFFKEHTAAYQVLQGVETAFHLASMAMQIEAMIVKITATTAGTTASVAAAGAEGTAWGVVAMVKAIAAAPPPWNYIAIAATAAALAAIGIAVAGAGASSAPQTTFDDHQKTQGTGTVAGDPTAKSNSMVNSLKIIEDNSSIQLGYQSGMLEALKSIQTALGGASKNLAITGGLINGSAFGTVNSNDPSVFGASHTTTILDSGVKLSGSFGALRQGMGTGNQYEDVRKTSDGGLFRSGWTDDKTNLKGLSPETMKQFGMVFDNLGTTLVEAGKQLGMDSANLTTQINAMPVNLSVSLRGLTGQALTDALNATISASFDQITTKLFPEVAKFQKNGEGLGETLVRVATDARAVDATFKDMGKSANGMSLTAKENLVEAMGGLSQYVTKQKSFMDHFYSDAERTAMTLAKISPLLASVGINASASNASQAYRDLMVGLDTTTPKGAALYAQLMDIQDAFIDVTTAANDERKSLQDQFNELTMTSSQRRTEERKAIIDTNKALYDQIIARKDVAAAYKTESDAIKTIIDAMRNAKASTLAYKDSLSLGSLSTMTAAEKAAEAQRQYQNALAKVRSNPSDSNAYSAAQQAATAYLTASQTVNGSSLQQVTAVQQVQDDMATLAAVAGQQLDDSQLQLIALDKSVEGLITLNETAIGIKQAIENLRAADTAARVSAPPVAATQATGVNPSALMALRTDMAAVVTAVNTNTAAVNDQTGTLTDAAYDSNALNAHALNDAEDKRQLAVNWKSGRLTVEML